MKFFRTCVSIAALAFVTSAFAAGGEGNNTGCNGVGNPNSPCTGNGGGSGPVTNTGGTGGSAAANAVSQSAAIAAAIAAQQQAQQQRQQQAQLQGQAQQQSNTSTNRNNNDNTSSASNANSNSASNSNTSSNSSTNTTGNSTAGSGNTTTLNYERSAPSVSATAPVYVRNCRIGIGAGGSNANGSFTAAIPLGNDATCLAGAALEAMQIAGGFSIRSKQTVACTIEGMEVLDECKKLKEEKKAEAVLSGEKLAGLQLYGN